MGITNYDVTEHPIYVFVIEIYRFKFDTFGFTMGMADFALFGVALGPLI